MFLYPSHPLCFLRCLYLILLVTKVVLGAVQGMREGPLALAPEGGEVGLLDEVVEDGLYGGGGVVLVLVDPVTRVSGPVWPLTAPSSTTELVT